MEPLDKYKDKEVVVRAGGLIYRGVLKGVTEESINLKGLTGWIEIPIGKVTSIRGKDEKAALDQKKFVDSSFWDTTGEENREDS